MARQKLAAFDMDGTLIQGRVVFALADKFGFSDQVREIQSGRMPGYAQSKAIAALLAGLNRGDLEDAIQSIPLTTNCEQAIAGLRDRNYRIGIISDSYAAAARVLADRLRLDFIAANELEMLGDKITGRVEMPLGWEKIGCFCKLSVCKRFHLEKFAHKFGVAIQNTLAVGDTKSDACMIESAGTGVVFMPKDSEIEKASKKIVHEPNLLKVLEYVS